MKRVAKSKHKKVVENVFILLFYFVLIESNKSQRFQSSGLVKQAGSTAHLLSGPILIVETVFQTGFAVAVGHEVHVSINILSSRFMIRKDFQVGSEQLGIEPRVGVGISQSHGTTRTYKVVVGTFGGLDSLREVALLTGYLIKLQDRK